MNKRLQLKSVMVILGILAFFICNVPKTYSSETGVSITLPFNYLDYCNWVDEYDKGERNDHPYGSDFSFDSIYGGDPELVRVYLDTYRDDAIRYYSQLNTNNKSFKAYILFSGTNKIITVSNSQIVDRISIGGEGKDYKWKELTFVITKEFDITVYKNTLKQNKVTKQEIIARYKILDNGEIVKVNHK